MSHGGSDGTLVDPEKPHEKPIVVDFGEEGSDPEDPFNWPRSKKISALGCAFFFSTLTAFNAAGYSGCFATMLPDLQTSRLTAIFANAGLLWTCAVAPLLLAPISEQFGRRPMLLGSGICHTLCFLPQALAPNIWMIILFRSIQGIASSGANSLVGGLVADVYRARDRGTPMTLFTLIIFAGQGAGAMCFSYIDATLGWRWCFWINLIINGTCLAGIYFLLAETRGSAILEARAIRLTKETGRPHLANTSLVQTLPFWTKLRRSVTRPVIFLFTEPTVALMALWTGCLWGEVFLFYSSIGIIYPNTYGFSTIATGSVFATAIIGGCLGGAFAKWTDRFYLRAALKAPSGHPPPEARLYSTCLGGILVPASLFMFAWTARPNIHWMVSIVALVLFNLGTYPIYNAGFSYIGDSYEEWASSAIAAQSLLRNTLAGVMPLVVPSMYSNLSYPIAGTVLAVLTLVFAPVPFFLVLRGGKLRRLGKVAAEVAKHQEELSERRIASQASMTRAATKAVVP